MMIISKDKRNPRMTRVQKERLLCLIETYFEHNNCVNEKSIDSNSWKSFADQLNLLGPSKDVENWQSSLHYMKLRVKTKLDVIVKKCIEEKQPLNFDNNLSEIDRKVVNMFYTTTLIIQNVNEKTNENVQTVVTANMAECVDKDIHPNLNYMTYKTVVDETFYGNVDENVETNDVVKDYSDLNELDLDMMSQNALTTVLTSDFRDFADMSGHARESIDDFVTHEPITNNMRTSIVTSSYGSAVSELLEFIDHQEVGSEESHTAENPGNTFEKPSSLTQSGQSCVQSAKSAIHRARRPAISSSGRTGPRPVRNIRKARVIRKTRPSRGSIRATGRTGWPQRMRPNVQRVQRVSIDQKRRLLYLVERNFLRTVGRFSGFNGVIIKRRLWEEYSKELNALGPPFRSAKGWENAFTSIRLNAKYKVAKIRNERNKNGTNVTKLTEIDDRILKMFGTDIVDGNQELGEGGFPYKKTLPFHEPAESNDNSSCHNLNDTNVNSLDTTQNTVAGSVDYINDPAKLNERINRLMSRNSNDVDVDRTGSSTAHNISRTKELIRSARNHLNQIRPRLNLDSAKNMNRVDKENSQRAANHIQQPDNRNLTLIVHQIHLKTVLKKRSITIHDNLLKTVLAIELLPHLQIKYQLIEVIEVDIVTFVLYFFYIFLMRENFVVEESQL